MHQEERHHRGDEVRVGDLPGAAVMAGVAALLLDDDDGVLASLRSTPPPPSAPSRRAPRQSCLGLLERRPHFVRDHAAGKLHGDGRSATLVEREEARLDALLVRSSSWSRGARGSRPAAARTRRTAECRGTCRRARRRPCGRSPTAGPSMAPHRDHDAEHGGDDAEPGSASPTLVSVAAGMASLVVDASRGLRPSAARNRATRCRR